MKQNQPCEKTDCTAYCVPCQKCGLSVQEYNLCKDSRVFCNYLKSDSREKTKGQWGK